MSLKHQERDINIFEASDKEHDKLESFLNKLVYDNNVCKILSNREICGGKFQKQNKKQMNVMYSSTYNFKQRRFIIRGNKFFTKMWEITQMVHDLLRQKNEGNKSFTTEEITAQVHVIEKDKRLDNLEIERINKCFLLIILDYADSPNSVYIRNYGETSYRNQVLEQVIREDSLDHEFMGGINGVDEEIIPEITSLYNSENKCSVSVLHKNICYVTARKVLYHNSWLQICDY